MTRRAVPDRVVVAIQKRSELDAALDRALDLLMPAAVNERVGIVVTRLTPGRYEVRLNAELPPGTTKERWGISFDEPQ